MFNFEETASVRNGALITRSWLMYVLTRIVRIRPFPDANAYNTLTTAHDKIINKSHDGLCQLNVLIKFAKSGRDPIFDVLFLSDYLLYYNI